ncbi:hypothetical protein ACODT3_40410 [Streptomyces sp. 4.24]|uniref:hypothetical protein n=1 Tax=Streptomyces tritrimontium TaxID=3406573 RepID=UPI003BB51BB3
MLPHERLDSILGAGSIRGFPPFGVSQTRCVCFSESPPSHLAHLITERGFAPWGVVATRSQVIGVGGGSVAYVPSRVRSQFEAAGLGHWAVRVDDDSQWMHEREWRIPLVRPDGKRAGGLAPTSLAAILVGDAHWRPTPITAWVHGADGTQAHPEEPGAVPVRGELPALWLNTPIWVWDQNISKVRVHPAGTLT